MTDTVYKFDPDKIWFTSDTHFGHVHGGPRNHTGLDHPRLQYLFPRQYDVGVDNNDYRPVSFAEVKSKIEEQVRRAQEGAGVPSFGDALVRNIVFLDPVVAPVTEEQKTLFGRIASETGAKTIELQPEAGETVKEAIARRIAAIGGSTRYVYIGTQPLQDFRCVHIDPARGLTEDNVDIAIKILK